MSVTIARNSGAYVIRVPDEEVERLGPTVMDLIERWNSMPDRNIPTPLEIREVERS